MTLQSPRSLNGPYYTLQLDAVAPFFISRRLHHLFLPQYVPLLTIPLPSFTIKCNATEQEDAPLEYLTGPPPPAQEPQPFVVPEVKGTAGAWGPAVGSFPEKFRDMPFQPFSKSDRLGKAADITGTAFQSRQNRYQSMFGAGDAYVKLPFSLRRKKWNFLKNDGKRGKRDKKIKQSNILNGGLGCC